MFNRSRFLITITLVLMLILPHAANADFELEYMGDISGLQVNISDSAWREALERGLNRAIDPGDYICSDPTGIDFWLAEQFSQMDPRDLDVLDFLGGLYWSFDAKLIIDHDASDEYIGVSGEYTRRQNKTFKDNKRFWDVFSDDILLMGAHGNAIADDELMAAFMPIAFHEFPGFVHDAVLSAVRNSIQGGWVDLWFIDPVYSYQSLGIPGGYDNPLLTLNAIAFSAFEAEIFPGSGIIPDKIIMGEGLLQALTDIGIGHKEGPDSVLSHEFAHHVQFEIDAFEPPPATPEKTRRTELMADGFAAYYASHARGNTFQAKRFVEVMTAAYETGDCAFSNPGHHGTHIQRLKAAYWGNVISDAALKKGHIISSETMLELFEEALPILLLPDAP